TRNSAIPPGVSPRSVRSPCWRVDTRSRGMRTELASCEMSPIRRSVIESGSRSRRVNWNAIFDKRVLTWRARRKTEEHGYTNVFRGHVSSPSTTCACRAFRVGAFVMSDTSIKNFEGAIPELESIVKKLEEGNLPLEQSLALYERGVQLSRFCHARLEEAERRIEILTER